MRKTVWRVILSSLALLLAVQFAPFQSTLTARAQNLAPDAPEDGDPMHIMSLAPESQMSSNLLGNWTPWSSGFTRETVSGPSGAQVSAYKTVNGQNQESGMSQSLTGMEPGTYILSGWSKAAGVERQEGVEYSSYALAADVVYTDNTTKWFHTGFSYGTHDWEFRDVSFTARKPVRSITVYVFLRMPGTGTAWFDGIELRRGKEDATSTFQNLPVQVLRTAPGETTQKTLKTGDGLELGLGSSTVTSLKIDGDELANNAYSGFLVRDVAQTSKGIYSFAPSSGSAADAFKGTQPELDLSLNADYTAKDTHIAVSGTIRDSSAAAEGRAVALSYALPVSASGWKWGRDIQSFEEIRTGGTGDLFKELGEGNLSVVDWDSVPRSMYPVSVIYNEDLGLAIAVSMDFPSYYELEYNGSTGQYVLTYHLGIVPEAPDAARFSFVVFKLDRPEWGFRAAMEKYTRIFPGYYEVLEKDQGLWVAWTLTSNVVNPQDFNFKFKEEGGEYYRIEGFYEMENDIKGYQYVEMGDWWLSNAAAGETAVEAAIALQASKDKSIQATRQAIATAFCRTLDPLGNLVRNPVNVPWAPNGVQIHINANPKLPGEYNFYNLYFSPEQMDILFDPIKSITVPFDGIYLDELSGWWLGNGNFNKAHYKYTTVPLTYSPYYKKPMLHRASTTWESVRQLRTDLRARNKTIFANKCPDKTSFYTPLIDAMGTEMSAHNGRAYTPQSIQDLSMWRTLSYQKPFCILLSNDYDIFDHDMMDKYMQRLLAFGIFPSPQASYSDNLQYWSSRKLYYERDRDLWQKYMPPMKKIAETGWEAVTLAKSDNPGVLVERFGKNADGGVYFTLYNNTDEAQYADIAIDLQEFSPGKGVTFRELVSGKPVVIENGVFSANLNPNQTLVLAINNPEKPKPPTSSGTASKPGTGGGDGGHVPTGSSPAVPMGVGMILAAIAAFVFSRKNMLSKTGR